MEKKPDLRVMKTRRAIREAFTQLLAEKPFAAITVQNILDRAQVNRKTFYNHYHDKYDLAKQAMNDVGQDLRETAERILALNTTDHLHDMYNALQRHRVEVLALWDVKADDGGSLNGLLGDYVRQLYLERAEICKPNENACTVDLQARMYAALATAYLKFVLELNGEYDFATLQRAIAAIPHTMFAEGGPWGAR